MQEAPCPGARLIAVVGTGTRANCGHVYKKTAAKHVGVSLAKDGIETVYRRAKSAVAEQLDTVFQQQLRDQEVNRGDWNKYNFFCRKADMEAKHPVTVTNGTINAIIAKRVQE